MRDLLVAENVGAWEPLKTLDGHAVAAAEVAAVGDADAQILDAASVSVAQRDAHALATPLGRVGSTHSLSPSAQCSSFQIGTRVLICSMMKRVASSAGVRCWLAVAMATLTSPSASEPRRCSTAIAPTPNLSAASATI